MSMLKIIEQRIDELYDKKRSNYHKEITTRDHGEAYELNLENKRLQKIIDFNNELFKAARNGHNVLVATFITKE